MHKEAWEFHLRAIPAMFVAGILVFMIQDFGVAHSYNEEVFVSFQEDVRPIFSKRCASCHNAGSVLPNFLDYDVAYKNRKLIQSKVVDERTMPHAGYMSESERDLVDAWVRSGAKK